MNRRLFLKSISALAAIAVVHKADALIPLTVDETERFMKMAKSGIVENQTFLLKRPITIDFPNLTINKCTFIIDFDIYPYSERSAIEVTQRGLGNLVIKNCDFLTKNYLLEQKMQRNVEWHGKIYQI